ncbi:hypothetical protein FS749_014270 [Ceratobasidium sp. UAMH 11750]|nr:hypothetical protein FS749_014270 [Ceratobasidium sp. UAMH 11750]
MASLQDLAFLVPGNLDYYHEAPPKFLLFMESKELCQRASHFLRKRLPLKLRSKIVWVHADMSREHNERALARLRTGEIFGIVCTDVAGMCQPTGSMSILWQRLGRVGRNGQIQAIGVLLVEKKHFQDEKDRLTKAVEARQRKKRKLAHQALLESETKSSIPTVETNTGSSSSAAVAPHIPAPTGPILVQTPPSPLPSKALPKKNSSGCARPKKSNKARTLEPGLSQYINSHLNPNEKERCRHPAINHYFGNPVQLSEEDVCCERCLVKHAPSSLCCDVCSPALSSNLFGSMDDIPRKRNAPRQKKLPPSSPSSDSPEDIILRSRLKNWRGDAASKLWGPFFPVGGLGIILDTQIERIVGLARLGLVPDTNALKVQLKWCFHSEFGADVVALIHEVYPTSPTAHANPRTPAKRKASRLSIPGVSPSTNESESTRPNPGTEPKAPRRARKCGLCGGVDHIASNTVLCPVRRQQAREKLSQQVPEQTPKTELAATTWNSNVSTLKTPSQTTRAPYAPLNPSPLSIQGQPPESHPLSNTLYPHLYTHVPPYPVWQHCYSPPLGKIRPGSGTPVSHLITKE